MKPFSILLAILLSTLISFGQSVHIGDILCTDGSTISAADFPTSGRTAWGIVFYVDDNDTHGWAVALHNQSSSIKWSSSSYYGYDIPNLVNFENARAAMHNLDGNQNTNIIRNAGSPNDFPAAWAADYDNGWFLPSAGQLRYLYSYFPEINASLQVVGGDLFPFNDNYYWWSSSEFSGYHAYDMNSGGSIGDYVKDNHVNYPPYGIAVRQIRDFDIPNVVPATYHVGDLITNDDGSQGILFYVSPDQTEGWMVALNDASTSISWGDGDVPGLDNQTYSSPFGMLLYETNGFANTGIIRDYQNGMNTAANAVDYEHGWYLPAAGQLSKLFGALPFVENKLQAYGSILEQAEYWSSSEADANEAFAVSYKPSANVRAGGFIRRDKSQNYRVRAVRNLSPIPLPTVGEITTLESICENGVLTLQAPETQSATSEGWQISPTLDFNNPILYEGQPLDISYNGWFLRYFAANEHGTVYSNIVSITVWPTYENSFSTMACTHYVWNGIDYDESGDYEQSFTSIYGCDSIVTMHLTIADVVTTEWSQQTCEDSFVWNGITYSETGDYEQTFSSTENCDSIVTLHLSIIEPLTHEWSMEVCDYYTWNDTTYTESGDYTQEFITPEGCDSIVTLHLALSDALEVDADTVACGSLLWNGQEYTDSGHYEQQFVTANGCDSLVRMDLTVLPFPEPISEIIGLQEVFVSSDIVLGQYNYLIESVEFATHYEWTLEDADWPMDTTGTQCALWVTTSGTASLKVRAWNTCGYSEQEIIIHAGFFDVDNNQALSVAIYPNPAYDKVFIEAEGIVRVRLYDLLGQCLIETEGSSNNLLEIITNNLPTGIYAIEILTEQGKGIRKLNVTR